MSAYFNAYLDMCLILLRKVTLIPSKFVRRWITCELFFFVSRILYQIIRQTCIFFNFIFTERLDTMFYDEISILKKFSQDSSTFKSNVKLDAFKIYIRLYFERVPIIIFYVLTKFLSRLRRR